MNSRERILAALQFERPDRLPCDESFWEDTLGTWREQGMPAGVDAADFFDFDICTMSLDTSPRLEQKILKREGGYLIYRDRFGYTLKKQNGKSSSMEFSDQVTTDRDAWERIKPRFTLSEDPNEPARLDEASYFAHFDPYPSWKEVQRKYVRLREAERYMLFQCYGPWEASWRHRKMDELLMDVALSPDWIQDMSVTYTNLIIAILERCLSLEMKPDGLFLVEDLGSTRSPLMSPKTWREVFKPSWLRLGAFLKTQGIAFWIHSCGAIEPLLEDLLDCGVQVVNPLQVFAGFDAVELRKRYGKRFAYYGNIDVKKMLGPRALLKEEIQRKVPLAREGGFIFHSDHSVPPQVGFEQYSWMLQKARAIFSG